MSQIHSQIAHHHARGLIEFFYAINQRTALDRDTPRVIGSCGFACENDYPTQA